MKYLQGKTSKIFPDIIKYLENILYMMCAGICFCMYNFFRRRAEYPSGFVPTFFLTLNIMHVLFNLCICEPPGNRKFRDVRR
jgi:hypothetical protein